jgi:hypothetical protein
MVGKFGTYYDGDPYALNPDFKGRAFDGQHRLLRHFEKIGKKHFRTNRLPIKG